jgi:hypothetical protein
VRHRPYLRLLRLRLLHREQVDHLAPAAHRLVLQQHFEDQMRATQREFGYPAVRLCDLASEVRLGRFGEELSDQDNAIFVPLIGISERGRTSQLR